MARKYHVSYQHRDGYGRCTVNSQRPIATVTDIADIEKLVAEDRGVEDPVVISWQELRPSFWRRPFCG